MSKTDIRDLIEDLTISDTDSDNCEMICDNDVCRIKSPAKHNVIDQDNLSVENEFNRLSKLSELMNGKLNSQLSSVTTDAKSVINRFVDWMYNNYQDQYLYPKFVENFDQAFIIELFETYCRSFLNTEIVSDKALIYWKLMCIHLIAKNKKYTDRVKDIYIDVENATSNLKLVIDKQMFRCYIDNERLCYFKENGYEYYTS